MTPFILALTGGSGSGKTTLAAALARALAPQPVLILSEDDYYHDNGAAPGFEAARFNFDDVAAHDHALLARHLGALRAGRGVEAPAYCYVTHRRLAESRRLDPAPLIIVEGVHVLCSAVVRGELDLAVYLDVPDDVRLARRLLRDMRERGRDAAGTVAQYLATVRPMHRRHTEPTRQLADLVLADPGEGALPPDPTAPDPAALDRLIAPVLARLGRPGA